LAAQKDFVGQTRWPQDLEDILGWIAEKCVPPAGDPIEKKKSEVKRKTTGDEFRRT